MADVQRVAAEVMARERAHVDRLRSDDAGDASQTMVRLSERYVAVVTAFEEAKTVEELERISAASRAALEPADDQ